MFLFKDLFYKFMFLFLIFCCQPLNAFRFSNLFKDYRLKKTYEKEDYYSVKEILQRDQIDNPNDAKLNYNLGIIFYKLNEFKDAQNSFIRAADNSNKNLILKEKSYFNAGNSFYKGAISLLGDNWKEEDLQDEVLHSAIEMVENAIENYKNVLVLDENNEEVKKNKKLAEELLEEIKKKLPEKEDQQKQDKQDKKNQNQDKDKQENSSQKDKNQQENDQEKNKQQESQKDKQCQDDKDKSNNDSQDQEQNQKKDDQKSNDEEQDGQEKLDEKSKDQENEQEQSDRDAENQNNEDEEERQSSAMNVAQETDQNDDMKEKGMLAILQDLQANESKIQKMLMKSKTGNRGPLNKGQKPW